MRYTLLVCDSEKGGELEWKTWRQKTFRSSNSMVRIFSKDRFSFVLLRGIDPVFSVFPPPCAGQPSREKWCQCFRLIPFHLHK